jgi:hypothetical protein
MDRIEERLRKHAIKAQSLSAMYAEKARIATEEYQQYKMNPIHDEKMDQIQNIDQLKKITNVLHTKGTRKKSIHKKYKKA